MKTPSVRILGLIGLGAALLMFVGDMCLYGHFGSGEDAISKVVITNESDTRIVVGGFIGPLADFVPAPLGAVISGGYLNLVFVLFFSVSVMAARSTNDTLQTHAT